MGRVERGGDKPFHTVINAENYHALETLLYAHEGQVDAMYLDPPYNTGARDWRYNNDYVDGNDAYRHSKWLSFMEKRVQLAKRLLNPEKSVLIVTIDEKEYLRLGLLLEQMFPEARIQMVSSVINPKGSSRAGQFARSDEYLFFVALGSAAPEPQHLGPDWLGSRTDTTTKIRWVSLIRSGTAVLRSDRPGMFYPVFLHAQDGSFHSIGDALPASTPRTSLKVPERLVAVWPIREDGSEGRWQVGPETARALRESGFLRVGAFNGSGAAISYLKSGEQQKVTSGVFGQAAIGTHGYVEVEGAAASTVRVPTTQWSLPSHSASEHGSRLLRNLIPGRTFDYPKSLYAVEDALRFFLADTPDALVVDFFGGSGTTAHAVMRLNHQDGGRRRSILVTNNEVSADEQTPLQKKGLLPGDSDWEARGIFEFITKPRIEAAVTGLTPDGKPVKGDYKFTDEFPMADGLKENVEFFRLTYEDRDRVELGVSFEAIAPLLWLKAGAQGTRVDHVDTAGWALPDGGRYGVLFDPDKWRDFVEHLAGRDDVTHAFLVTDSDAVFQQVVAELPAGVEPVRLYGGYLTSFAINTGSLA